MEIIVIIIRGLCFVAVISLSLCSSDCEEKDDIVFILDESGSVSKSDFNLVKQFTKEFVQNIDIGLTKSQVSVITYSSTVNSVIALNEYSDKASLVTAISNLVYRSGGTATHLALNYAYVNTFLASNGGRSEAKRIAILITDGQSNSRSDTEHAADELKHAGVYIVTIGVGTGIGYSELDYVASNHSVLNVSTFNKLHSVRSKLHSAVCEISATTTCHRKPTDIMFIIDTTTEDNTVIDTSLNVIQHIVSKLPANSTKRVAGVGISFQPLLITEFTNYTDNSLLMSSFRSINHSRAPIFTEEALRMASMKFHMDYTRSRYAVMIYNGMSTYRNNTILQAKYLSRSAGGITVMTVGNGIQVDQTELIQVSSSKRYTFSPYRYDLVNRIIMETSTHCNDCTESSFSDILFMIDASASNSISEFNSLQNTVEHLADLMLENLNDTRIGMLSFSDKVRTSFKLANIASKGFVREKVNQIRQDKSTAEPHKALEHVRLHGFEMSNGGRPGSRKFAILFSNARWNKLDQIRFESNLLRAANVTVITIGVGREVNLENYAGIASSAYHSYLIFNDDLSALNAIVSESKYVVCTH